MAYIELVEGFSKKVKGEGEEFLLGLLEGLYADDLDLDGKKYAIRRMSDTIIDDEEGIVRTEFFCFPQNGEKNKLQAGGIVSVESRGEVTDSRIITFTGPKNVSYKQPTMHEIYSGVVATRARKLLVREETNNFLFHDIFITTPDKETFKLEEFPFAKHRLFMLGLIGNEYQISIRDKVAAEEEL